jgi:hypothetical protein
MMQKLPIFLFLLIASLLLGCKKANIRHELSGTWTVEKAEVSHFTNGVQDSSLTFENPGTLRLTDTGDKEFNRCQIALTGYFPRGLQMMLNSPEMDSSYVHWYGNSRDRDRLSFWASFNGFPLLNSEYTRTQRGRGIGRTEEWLYIALDDSQRIATKEILTVKLTDGSGRIE